MCRIEYKNIIFENTNEQLNHCVIRSIENFLDVKFPKDYYDFLKNINGGVPTNSYFKFINCDCGSILSVFYGMCEDCLNDLLENYRCYCIRIPSNTFAIASDLGGNQILLSVKGKDKGKVYFWDHEQEAQEGEVPDYSNLTLIANSFDEFLGMLRPVEEIDD